MAPWELPEFLKERVERGRRLLAEREEYRGSADLQAFIQGMDLTVLLYRTFIGEDGQARHGLSERQRQQATVTFLRGMMLQLELPTFFAHLEGSCCQAVYTSIISAQRTATTEGLALLGKLGIVAFRIVGGSSGSSIGTQEAAAVLSMEWGSCRAAAEQLEQCLREQCFEPLLSAADVQRLFLLLQHELAHRQAGYQYSQQAAELWAVDEKACRQLIQLDPGCAAFWSKHGTCLNLPRVEKDAASQRALQLAKSTNAHFVHCRASLFEAGHLLTVHREHPSPTSAAAVRSMLTSAEEEFRLAKAWLPHMIAGMWKKEVSESRADIEEILAAQPGEEHELGYLEGQSHMRFEGFPVCAACGRRALSVRKCAACRAVSYCSTECQRRHWKAPGGHRRECAALAASRNARQHGTA